MMPRLPLFERNASYRRRRSSNGSGSAVAETCCNGLLTSVICGHRSGFHCRAIPGTVLPDNRVRQQTAVKTSTPTAAFAESP
jgi:hypothetical protein